MRPGLCFQCLVRRTYLLDKPLAIHSLHQLRFRSALRQRVSKLQPRNRSTESNAYCSQKMAFSLTPQSQGPLNIRGVPTTLASPLTPQVLNDFIPYRNWINTLQTSLSVQHSDSSHPFHNDPYKLHSVEIQSCDIFGGSRLGFLKLKANVTNSANEHFPGAVFMRGGSVAMLIVLQGQASPSQHNHNDSHNIDEDYVILTVQPRIPAGSLSFVELPAGMIDDSGTFGGAAAKEIKEETGLDIKEDELVDMTRLAIQARDEPDVNSSSDGVEESHLQQAVYPSPGGCDEFIPIFLVKKTMPKSEIDGLKGKLTGLRNHGEKITLKICKLRDLWKVGARDGKTLAAVALYEGLKREGKV